MTRQLTIAEEENNKSGTSVCQNRTLKLTADCNSRNTGCKALFGWSQQARGVLIEKYKIPLS